MAAITAIEKAVACLEEEKAALWVIVVGRDAKDSQTLPLTEKLLLTGIYTMMRGRLQKEHELMIELICLCYYNASYMSLCCC